MMPEGMTPSPAGAGASQIELAIVETFAELLQVDGLSGTSDMFDYGANSLTVQQLIWRIQDLFDVDIPLTAIFDAPTPRELAAQVEILKAG